MHFGLFKLSCAAYKPQPTKEGDSACIMDVDSLADEVRSLKKKSIVLCIMEVDLPANHLQFQECVAGTNIAFSGGVFCLLHMGYENEIYIHKICICETYCHVCLQAPISHQ